MINGSFESGMDPGWYVGGTNPEIWQIYTNATNTNGMGFRWATTYMPPLAATATGQLIQDLYIPADATSATLQWSERIWNFYPPGRLIGVLRIRLYQGGVPIAYLENATGNESIFLPHTWVSRSTNLMAFAGQSLQLVVEADSYQPLAANYWYADVDGFTLSCQHPANPEFQVYLGRNSILRSTNLVADIYDLSFASIPLASSTTYYWRVGSVRDGVTNYSATWNFRTGQRVLPALTVQRLTSTGVQFSFPTHTNRNYIIEQRDTMDGTSGWYDVLWAGPGNGAPMQFEVPLPWGDTAFWRLRVEP